MSERGSRYTGDRDSRKASRDVSKPMGEADFSAPLGSTTSGTLVFTPGAAGLKLLADSSMAELIRAHFEGQVPEVNVEGGTVTVAYRRVPIVDWLLHWREPLARVILNGAIPWRVQLRGGASNVEAEMQWLELLGMEIEGGASQVALSLPRPGGTVAMRIGGGASNLTLYRPMGVEAQVTLDGGASNLTLDDQYLGSVGGAVRWQTSGYAGASDRYDIQVAGGSSHLTVARR